MITRPALLFTAAAIFAVSCAGGSTGPATVVPAVLPATFSCSWPALSNADELNIAYPDANATYWAQPLSLAAGKSSTISGSFPGARYFSYATYNADGSPYSETPIVPMTWPPAASATTAPGLNSEIDDAQLGASTGINYFASSNAAPLPPTGTYHLTITAGPPSLTTIANPAVAGSVAVLAAPTPAPGAIAGSTLTGWVLYRIYAPYAGTPAAAGTAQEQQFIQGGVELPLVDSLPACKTRSAEPVLTAIAVAPIGKLLAQAATPAPEPAFQYDNGGSLFPNDDNKYVYAATTWQPGRLIIVTGTTPTFPNTPAQAIVQSPATDVRYWSMCTNKDAAPAPVVMCADDQQTRAFAPSPGSTVPPTAFFANAAAPPVTAGTAQYAYVISSTADKPANLNADFTWLPWFAPLDEPPSPGSAIPGVLIVRNMLPVPAFIHAIQNIPTYGQSAAQSFLASFTPPQDPSLAGNPTVQAIAVMGSYYPAAVYCDRAIFNAAYGATQSVGGTIAACVQAAGF